MAGQEVVTCFDEMNRFLNDFPYERNNGGAIFIHQTILAKFSEKISRTGWQITEENSWPYNVRIGKESYEMYLIWIDSEAMLKSKLHLIVPDSKYSFPWESNLTIYTTAPYFYLVEQFIKTSSLKKFVLNRYHDKTQTCLPYEIKVLEFTQNTPRDVLQQFRTFLEINDYILPNSYFATRAFKFLRPNFLKQVKPCYDPDIITQVILLLDYHRVQSKLGIEIFNLFDLIAMKMAIDDIRFEYINCEFNKLVYHKLNEMAARRIYIKSRRLSLVDYHYDLGIPSYTEEIYQYLISQYWGYFDRVGVHEYGIFKVPLLRIKNINDLSTGCFNRLDIGVYNLTVNKSNLLMEILSNQNLGFQPIITFDTSNEFECATKNCVYDKVGTMPSRSLKFVGNNLSCYIENFFNWIKQTIGNKYENFDIKFVATKINCPYILRDLELRMVVIKKMQITCKLLWALKSVKFEIIKMTKCFMDNDPNIFVLLESLSGDRYVQINSDEHTFGTLMDAIKMQLRATGRKDFRFKSYITVYYLESEFEFIDLSRYKFSFDETGTKVVARDLFTDEMVDILDYFYRPPYDEYRADEL